VVLVTRTRHFAGKLQPQFARGEVKKSYLVRVKGRPTTEHFQCDAPISTESGELGSRMVDTENGAAAQTEFSLLQTLPDGTSLLEARPLTGRTNQIRIHCAHLGLPILGDDTYVGGATLGTTQTLAVDAPPLCLHAWKISFRHPHTRQPMEFSAPAPAWAVGAQG
ncbi:MAG TPA: RluA family pseudouridine synthase, partial [Verrucomicrobiae bacterium]